MELININFLATPAGEVEVRPLNDNHYILTENNREFITAMIQLIRERYPKAFSNLQTRYTKYKGNSWHFDFLIVQGFIKCNMGGNDNVTDIDAEGNFHFEFSQCPLAGECKEFRETCYPVENLEISEAELRVLKHIAAGRTVDEIATILCRSRFTIENQTNSMLRKLKYHNNAQLVDYYHKHVAHGNG